MRTASEMRLQCREEVKTRSNNRLRKAGMLPGCIFGKNMKTVPVTVDPAELRKRISSFGRNSVFGVKTGDGNKYTVMIKDIQIKPMTGEYLHVNFIQVSLKEEIKTEVNIVLSGRERIEMQNLVLLQQTGAVTVKGLPNDIPDKIEIDVSEMQSGDTITVGQIEVPDGIVVETDPDHLVATIYKAKHESVDEAPTEDIEPDETK